MPKRLASTATLPLEEDTPLEKETAVDPGNPRRAAVLLPLPLAGAYDYLIPPDMAVEPGAVVAVPFGKRELSAVVWEILPDEGRPGPGGESALPLERLRPVLEVLPVPPLTEVARRFLRWVADYTLASPGAVLRMALSAPAALQPPRPLTLYRRSEAPPPQGFRLTPARRRLLEVFEEGPARALAEAAAAGGVGTSVVKGLVKAGLVEAVSLQREPGFPVPDLDLAGPALSDRQASACETLHGCIAAQDFSVTLLDGVTGSGKTEVYFEALAAALAAGRQALVLLPEIALSAQWLERFEARFGVAPALWHSDLTSAQRRAIWRAVAFGRASVVVGARSALFLPYSDLGLIVVDEEHEAAFKQEDGVAYHARDMAVVRAQLGKIPVILASATPSIETLNNVQNGRYGRLELPERHGGALLPRIDLVDLLEDKPPRLEGMGPGGGQAWLSTALRAAMAETLAASEQVLLFLNRRGYAPLTLCRACGHRLQCPNCTAWLVEHRLAGRLQCHHCGFASRLPKTCPDCGAEGSLAACGPGVERLAEEARALFPQARLGLMTSDTLTGPDAAAEMVRAVQAQEIDLLIGTQIVAKGHHFPHLTLVGVVDADLGLYGGDLRAAERTYQLLHQVAGRAGRAERPGRVLLQTSEPEHPVMQALAGGQRDPFLAAEAQARENAGLPPFGRLAALILSSPDARQVDALASALARRVPRIEGLSVLGPAPAPLAVLRGRHRRRFLIKAPRGFRLQAVLSGWLGDVKLPSNLRLQVDIDPYSFL
ncbi:primosomal protein N' [Pelagibius litoralis]|uniref:Replication restart protein PriA n=1 Tax=Pelagibius litoralis TaxID=374515 RepID=A0A967CBK9_9PROT|nr:primosomal protein N' [Pelagibius litoralis]NIA68279.1 primosomal protein N' [Pelagibius litoralis]